MEASRFSPLSRCRLSSIRPGTVDVWLRLAGLPSGVGELRTGLCDCSRLRAEAFPEGGKQNLRRKCYESLSDQGVRLTSARFFRLFSPGHGPGSSVGQLPGSGAAEEGGRDGWIANLE